MKKLITAAIIAALAHTASADEAASAPAAEHPLSCPQTALKKNKTAYSCTYAGTSMDEAYRALRQTHAGGQAGQGLPETLSAKSSKSSLPADCAAQASETSAPAAPAHYEAVVRRTAAYASVLSAAEGCAGSTKHSIHLVRSGQTVRISYIRETM